MGRVTRVHQMDFKMEEWFMKLYFTKSVLTLAAVTAMGIGVVGCHHDHARRAGSDLKDVARQAGDEIKDSANDVGDTVHDATH